MKIKQILSAFLLAFVIWGCEEQLDPKIDNTYGDEHTWGHPVKAQGVLMNAYATIPQMWDNWGGNNFLDVATDDAVTNDYKSGLYDLAHGRMTHQNNPLGNWETAYNQFRNIHMFLENGLGDSITYILSDSVRNVTVKERLRGEAYFLRAWWGMELLRRYGGVADDGEALGYIIVRRDMDDEDLEEMKSRGRDTYEACVQQIISDCDTAIKFLPLEYNGGDPDIGETHIGRGSGKAAWALKSRVSVMGASPAFQPESSYAVSEDSVMRKWERAAKLSYQAIEEGQLGGYTTLTESHFNDVESTPDEFIFRQYFNNRWMESRNFPPYFFGQGFTNPSQNLVDAFPDDDGYPIMHPDSDYDPQAPYQARDPRLDLTVYYNGRTFGDRELEIYYDVEDDVEGRDAPGFEYNTTRTGYYLRKWLSQKSDMLEPNEEQNDRHQHALLRRGEVYFNLAEALNELVGPVGTYTGSGSYTAESIIREARRQAIGINDDPYLDEVIGEGKDAFRSLIQNEKRLEFAFENMRYFDMRRWMLPLDEPVRGCEVEKTADGFVYKGTDPSSVNEDVIVEERLLDDSKYYYVPLPYSEVIKNRNMKDNKGWSF